jgi:hypothetical protein
VEGSFASVDRNWSIGTGFKAASFASFVSAVYSQNCQQLGCLYAEVGYLKEAVDILLACREMDNKLYVSVIVNDGRVGSWFPLVAWCSLHERFSFMK